VGRGVVNKRGVPPACPSSRPPRRAGERIGGKGSLRTGHGRGGHHRLPFRRTRREHQIQEVQAVRSFVAACFAPHNGLGFRVRHDRGMAWSARRHPTSAV
jgi:hypothetical protein